MRLEKIHKIFWLTLLSVVCLFSAQQVSASEFTGGKCQSFARENHKLLIFSIGNNDSVLADPNVPGTAFEIFCVEVANNTSVVEWVNLRDSSRFIKQNADKLQRGEYVREEKSDNGNSTLSWNTTQDDNQPASITYHATPYVPSSGVFTRYYFEGEDAGLNMDFQVYYVATASLEQQLENPVGICAQNNGKDKSTCEANSQCFWQVAGAKCLAKDDSSIDCTQLPSDVCSAARHCTTGENNTCVKKTTEVEVSKAIDQYIAERYKAPDGYQGPLPSCAFTGSCRNVEDLVQLGVNVATWLFGIIAGLGFAFFVYGGLTMVLSFGNSEKVGQGKQILVAATVGMIIAFSAYVLVSFIVKAIGITS